MTPEQTLANDGKLDKANFLMHLLKHSQSELTQIRKVAQADIEKNGPNSWVEVTINENIMRVNSTELRKCINQIRSKIGYR